MDKRTKVDKFPQTFARRYSMLLVALPGILPPDLWLLADSPELSGSPEGLVLTGTDDIAQLPFWEWQSEGMSIRLVQRLPDQSRGYFMARGFNKQQAERIAQSCIFQTVYKNTAPSGSSLVIEYNLSKWKAVVDGKSRPLKLREDWEREWRDARVAKRAQIALQWSLLPTRQRYQAQDYNWGMTSYGIPPGTRFDLHIVWKINGEAKTGQIKNLQCAPDVHPEPTGPLN